MTTNERLKKIIRPLVESILRERSSVQYYIEYYATVGGHGDTGKYYSDFAIAFKAAVTLSKKNPKDSDGEPFMDGLEYLGVESSGGNEFGVIFITDRYLRTGSQGIEDPENKAAWLAVAKKCLSSGKPQLGKYPN